MELGIDAAFRRPDECSLLVTTGRFRALHHIGGSADRGLVNNAGFAATARSPGATRTDTPQIYVIG